MLLYVPALIAATYKKPGPNTALRMAREKILNFAHAPETHAVLRGFSGKEGTMSLGHTIRLTGAGVEKTVAALALRLNELGHKVEPDHGGLRLIDAVSQEELNYEIDANDPPEFAAEKILDVLEERGWIKLDSTGVSAEEEAEITDRLRRLGYIE